MHRFLFVPLIPVKDAVIDSFCACHQQSIECAVVQPGDLIHFQQEGLDPPDLLLIAFAIEVEDLGRRLRMRIRLRSLLFRSDWFLHQIENVTFNER